ncbi:MAG: peptidoglycan DD-metalloendopeptidase family protein [Bacteroidota bacterium]
MKKNKRAWIIGIWMVAIGWLTAEARPSKTKFEADRAVLLQRIKNIQQILRQTATKKKAGIGQLQALNGQIESNALLIKTLSQELKGIDQAIQQKQRTIATLERDLVQLKQEYAAMVYMGVKSLQDINQLMFIFAASSFHELVQRLRHIKQYTRTRHQHFLEIEKVKAALQIQQTAAAQRRQAKTALLKTRQAEKGKLNRLKTQQTHLVGKLEQQQTHLAQELEQRNRAVKRLDKLIKDSIQRAKRPKPAPGASPRPLSASTKPRNMKKLTGLFRQNRGKLPWPVKTGFISSKFGIGGHPVLRNVQVENLGIDIQTQTDARVHAIVEGVVTTIAHVPGMHWVVIIQHGAYRSVYAKLKHTTVKQGQYVQTQTPIGTVHTDAQGTTELQLQLWKGTQKLNPAQWLCKK